MLIAKQGIVSFRINHNSERAYRIFVKNDCWYKTDNFDIAAREYEIIRHELGVFVSPYMITDIYE